VRQDSDNFKADYKYDTTNGFVRKSTKSKINLDNAYNYMISLVKHEPFGYFFFFISAWHGSCNRQGART